MRNYIKPKSVTFWAGAASIAAGAVLGVHEAHPLGWGADALASLIAPASPAMLFTNGLGLIGIRRAIARGAE